MTREQFDQAVTEAYPRLIATASTYLDHSDECGPSDLVHSVILAICTRAMSTLQYNGQAKFERYCTIKLLGWIADYKKKRRTLYDRYNFAAPQDVHLNWNKTENEGGEEEQYEIPDPAPNPLEQLEWEEIEKHVHESLKHLRENERFVVVGVLAGFTHAQLGELLSVSRPRVTAIHQQALKKLRKHLESYEHTEASGAVASKSSKRP